jgi:hypothetical protein
MTPANSAKKVIYLSEQRSPIDRAVSRLAGLLQLEELSYIIERLICEMDRRSADCDLEDSDKEPEDLE